LTESEARADVAVITAKRLDAEEVEEFAVEVEVPETEAGQRTQLVDLVRSRYPEAEFRSFADEAASFLAHKLLVVAAYRRSARAARPVPGADDGSQQQLFAA
jgi:hypothetical protein